MQPVNYGALFGISRLKYPSEGAAISVITENQERQIKCLKCLSHKFLHALEPHREFVSKVFDLSTPYALDHLKERSLRNLINIGTKVLNQDPKTGTLLKFREALFRKCKKDHETNSITISSVDRATCRMVEEFYDCIHHLSFHSKLNSQKIIDFIENRSIELKRNLRQLQLSHNDAVTDVHLIQWFQEMPNLELLYLHDCSYISSVGVEAIADGCPKLTCIRASVGNPWHLLGIENTFDDLIQQVIESKRTQEQVLDSFLQGTKWITLHPEISCKIVDILTRTPLLPTKSHTIFSLFIQSPKLFSVEAEKRIVDHLATLKEYVAPIDITDNELISRLIHMSNLEVLRLEQCTGISKEIISYLPERLRELTLVGCNQFEEDDLNRMVFRCPNLNHFEIPLNCIDPAPIELRNMYLNDKGWEWMESHLAGAKALFCLLKGKKDFRKLLFKQPAESLRRLNPLLLCNEQKETVKNLCAEIQFLYIPSEDMKWLADTFPNISALYLTEGVSGIGTAYPRLRELRVKICSDDQISEVVGMCPELETLEKPPTCKINPWEALDIPDGVSSLFPYLKINPGAVIRALNKLQTPESTWIDNHTEHALRLFEIAGERVLMQTNISFIYRYRTLLLPKLKTRLEMLKSVDVMGDSKCLDWLSDLCPSLERVENSPENPPYWRVLGVNSDVSELIEHLKNDSSSRKIAFEKLVHSRLHRWREIHDHLTEKIFALVKPEEVLNLYSECENKTALLELFWYYGLIRNQPKNLWFNGIMVNRHMIAMLSVPLNTMLLGRMKEGSSKSINIDELSRRGSRVFVSLVETGEFIGQSLEENDLIQITLFAHVYELNGLFVRCQRELLSRYSIEELDEFGIPLPYVESKKKLIKLIEKIGEQ